MNGYTRKVLVVASDAAERERLAALLEGDGFEVELCPGPAEPEYACIGVRLGRCPLATDACVVVLDMDLGAGGFAEGTAAEALLDFYREAGHGIVALSAQPIARDDEGCLRLRRHPEANVLRAAVWSSASPHRREGGRTGVASRRGVSSARP